MSIAEMDEGIDASVVIDVDMAVRQAMLGAKELDSLRRNNSARSAIIGNALDIELTRDCLSRILDDVRGVQ